MTTSIASIMKGCGFISQPGIVVGLVIKSGACGQDIEIGFEQNPVTKGKEET